MVVLMAVFYEFPDCSVFLFFIYITVCLCVHVCVFMLMLQAAWNHVFGLSRQTDIY